MSCNTLTSKRWPLLILTHDTTGGGVPEALQDRFKLPPSVIVSFCKGWMVDGTGVKNENESNKKKKDQQLFLLIDVIVGDIKIKQQAQILKLYVLQTTVWTTFSKGHLDWNCKWNSVAVYPARGELFKVGFSAKLECRYESLKSKFSLFFFHNLIIGCSKTEKRKLSKKILLISRG